MKSTIRNNNRGFTLVELLVVIAIIALLLSILMPGLSMAREQGRSVVCKSVLRQYGIAANVYAQNNKDMLVGGGNGSYEPQPIWTAALISFDLIPNDLSAQKNNSNPSNPKVYIPNAKFRCPSNKIKDIWASGMTYAVPVGSPAFYGKTAGGVKGTQWNVTLQLCPDATLARSTEVRRPSDVPHFLEFWPPNSGSYTIDASSAASNRNGNHLWNLYADVHAKKQSNLLFCDSHVSVAPKNRWKSKGETPDPWAYHFALNYAKPTAP